MKAAVSFGMAALLATAGGALADQPMVLTDAQLGQVTAGMPSVAVTPAGESAPFNVRFSRGCHY
jgi:hypothetical protein